MPLIQIRSFQISDLEAIARLAHLSFADPSLQEGGTPAAVTQRLRSLTSPRIRILTRLLRYRIEMTVAEIDGNVAGFIMLTGRDQINLNTLMVDPQYRRCGIGVALMEQSFQHVRSWGYPFTTAEVLATNLPSARLCQKLGFELYDTFTTYETPLPLSLPVGPSPRIWSRLRPSQRGERANFTEIERKLVSTTDLLVRGSAARIYFPSFYRRLIDLREHKQYQAWIVEKVASCLGFQYAHSSLGNPKGTLTRPLLPDAHLNCLPSIVELAGDWFFGLGKTSLRLEVPAERPHLIEHLSSWSWQPSVGWLCLVKWLVNG